MKIAAITAIFLGLAASVSAERWIVVPQKGAFGTQPSAQVFGKSKVQTVHMLKSIQARAVEVDSEDAIKELLQDPLIKTAYRDVKRYPTGVNHSDNLRRVLQSGEQTPYGVKLVGADNVPIAPGTTRNDLVVCIIDSGIDAKHEDLAAANLQGLEESKWNTDTCGHGTHVAGTIAAVKGNGKGVVGVVPGVAVYSVKVFDGSNCQWSWSSDLIAATEKCTAAAGSAKVVISMSLGGPDVTDAERDGFQALWDKGVFSIAAAGNDGTTGYSYPASYPSVFSVAAIDSSRRVASFSQKNDQVDISGPGVKVLSTYKGSYSNLDGTSMATPHVSAAAALVWSYGLKQGWTNAKVRDALVSTATDLGAAGRDNSYGVGLINACKAAKKAGFTGSVTCIDEDASAPSTSAPSTTKPPTTTAAPTTTKSTPVTTSPVTTKAPTTSKTPITTKAPTTQPPAECPYPYFVCCFFYGQC